MTNITGVDFGFNFDTIVNTADTGQGSLRQFVVNANALTGEAALAQAGLTAGFETSIFMIPNGVANPGQNIGYANQLTVGGANGGAARITLASALPAITGTNTILDGRIQTANVRATAGRRRDQPPDGGHGRHRRHERDRAAGLRPARGRDQRGRHTGERHRRAPVYVAGVAVENGSIIVAGNGSLVQDCLVGTNADGTVTTVYSANYGITIGAGTGISITHNYVKVNDSGIRGDATGASALIQYNEVDSLTGAPGGGQTNTFDGILIINSAANITVRYNLAKNQRGGGLEFGFGAGAVTGTVTENTLTTNGYNSAGVPSTEPINVAFYSLAAGTAMTFANNVVTASAGPGVVVESSTGITITQNSIFGNGGLGIDLDPRGVDPNNYAPAQGVTLNDAADADAGPNNLQNFPVIQSALVGGGNLTVTGWARPGSLIEFFVAAADPTGFGEGQTYVFSATEGSGSDGDATSSSYGPGAVNGVVQGTDTTNRFSFTVATPGGVSAGVRLTATARLAGSTSEFSAGARRRRGAGLLVHQGLGGDHGPGQLHDPRQRRDLHPGRLAEAHPGRDRRVHAAAQQLGRRLGPQLGAHQRSGSREHVAARGGHRRRRLRSGRVRQRSDLERADLHLHVARFDDRRHRVLERLRHDLDLHARRSRQRLRRGRDQPAGQPQGHLRGRLRNPRPELHAALPHLPEVTLGKRRN